MKLFRKKEKKQSEKPNEEPVKQEQQVVAAQPPPPSLWRDLYYIIEKLVLVAILFALLFIFIFGVVRYEDPSMAPAVKAGDLVFYYRLDKHYVARDTIVVEYQEQKQVRRVIAVAGDVVDITADGLMINGSIQQEPDIYEDTLAYKEGIQFPVTVGDGQVFVLGDKRENSTDSRIYGPVNIKDTLGKVMTIIRRRNI